MKNRFVSTFTLLLFVLFGIANEVKASHLTAVDLYYEHIQGDSFNIILKLYRDCDGINLGSTANIGIFSANCNQNMNITLTQDSMREVSQLCPSEIINSSCNSTAPNAHPGVQEFTYSASFRFPFQCTDWILSYQDCARNAAIDNILNPGQQCLYVETVLNNTAGLNNNSPVFTTIPVVYSCVNKFFNFNHGGIDQDGDSLVFSMVTPLDNFGSPVSFIPPNSATYPILDVRGFNTFDPTTGEITFHPSVAQSAVTAIKVEEYRNGVLIGSTTRDLQIIITNCSNSQPSTTSGIINNDVGTLIDSTSISTCSSDSLNFEIMYQDPDGSDQITITSNLNQVIPGASFTTSGTNPSNVYFHIPKNSLSGRKVFTVTVKDDGCAIYTTQIYTYSIIFIPGTYVGEDQVIFCPGGITAKLEAFGGTTFNWRAIQGDSIVVGTNFSCNPCQTALPTPDTFTIYEVTSNISSACGNKDTVAVRVEPGFFTSASSSDSVICDGDSVELDVTPSESGNFSYLWQPQNLMNPNNVKTPTATLSESTLFESYTTNDSTGCTVYDSVYVQLYNFPDIIELEDNLEICLGDTVNIEPKVYYQQNMTSLCLDYSIIQIPLNPVGGTGWSTSPTSFCDDCVQNNVPVGFDFNFFCNDFNSVSISSNGWISFDNLTNPSFNNDFIPDPNAPNNMIALCWDDLNPVVNGNIRYKTVGTAPNRTFVVRYDSVGFFFGLAQVLGEIHLIEADQSIEIHIINVTPFGNYTLGIENDNGTLGFSPVGYNNSVWPASSAAFRFKYNLPAPSNNFVYSWSPGGSLSDSTGTSILAYPDTNTLYHLYISDSLGQCNPLEDSVQVIVFNFPDVQTTISEDTICLGDTITVSTTPGYNYLWNNGMTTASFPEVPTLSTLYIVAVDSGINCVTYDSVFVLVQPLPPVMINANPSGSVCIGDSVTLIASGANSYVWNTGATTNSIALAPTSNGVYSVTGTNLNGCVNTSSKQISVNDFPVLFLSGKQKICANESTLLSASGAKDYLWSNGDTLFSTWFSASVSGYAYVTGTSAQGCSTQDSIFIIVVPSPQPIISGDTVVFAGGSTTLTCNTFNTYLWNNGESSSDILVYPESDTTFTVEVTDSTGCHGFDTIFISVTHEFILPNIITPNDDMSNDLFKIKGLSKGGDLKIFNRWGKMVYQNEVYDNSFNAEGLADGTYYYIYTAEKTFTEYRGWLKVIR